MNSNSAWSWGSQKRLLDGMLKGDESILNDLEFSEQLFFHYYDGLLIQPLVFAMYNNFSVDALQKIVEKGARVQEEDQNTGMFPIHHAAKLGRIDYIGFLLKHGAVANVQDQTNRKTPLHYAVESGNVETVFYLVSRGIDFEIYDLDGWTPLHSALALDFKEIVELLIRHGADVNSKNMLTQRTCLHLVSLDDNADMAIRLITLGADLTLKDFFGKTPIDLAMENGNYILGKVFERISKTRHEKESSRLGEKGEKKAG